MTDVLTAGKWPTLTDDPTPSNPTSGTDLKKSTFEDSAASIAAAINDQCDATSLGASYASTKPKDTTKEVIDARGNLATLSARLNPIVTPAGVFINPGYPLAADTTLAILENLAFNDQYLLWSLGDALAPDGWTLAGAGASIARTGSGLGDTTTPRIGQWAAKVIAGGGAVATLEQSVATGGIATRLLGLDLMLDAAGTNPPLLGVVGIAKGAVASTIKPYISIGGVVTSFGGGNAGSANWERMKVTASGLTSAWTSIAFGWQVAQGATGYLGPIALLLGTKSEPLMYVPATVRRQEKVIHISGNQTAGTRKFGWTPRRAGIITDCYLSIGTAPTGQALIVDVNTWDGAALTSMYTTKPQIAAAATEGHAQPDTTYARRCFNPIFTTSKAAGYLVTVDIDQVGSGAAGADLSITIGYLEFCRPWEAFYDYNTE